MERQDSIGSVECQHLIECRSVGLIVHADHDKLAIDQLSLPKTMHALRSELVMLVRYQPTVVDVQVQWPSGSMHGLFSCKNTRKSENLLLLAMPI